MLHTRIHRALVTDEEAPLVMGVDIASLVPQRSEPGRAPARPVIDESQPHQYIVMIRDLGSKRQPAAFITIGSTIIFLLCCWMLHRRDRIFARNTGATVPARA